MHQKHIEPGFQFLSTQIWCITDITRMPQYQGHLCHYLCVAYVCFCSLHEPAVLQQIMILHWQRYIRHVKVVKKQIFCDTPPPP